MQTRTLERRAERGFTLVELAIVLVIIGLLIGGILKGQELITNSRATTTVTQIKAIEAAAYTFRDTYQALPGDITAATTRVPNCTAPCAAGDGDGVIGSAPTAAVQVAYVAGAGGEGVQFFVHLGAAGLIDGVGTPAAGTPVVGQGLLATKLGNNFVFRAGNAAAAPAGTNAASFRPGAYLAIGTSANAAMTAAAGVGVQPNIVSRIDGKLDDGLPNTGNALASGAASATVGCYNGAGAAATQVYSTANVTATDATGCGMFVNILQ
jgi:prepilin-type N-terminal cleavage/methylation domain-containing protein